MISKFIPIKMFYSEACPQAYEWGKTFKVTTEKFRLKLHHYILRKSIIVMTQQYILPKPYVTKAIFNKRYFILLKKLQVYFLNIFSLWGSLKIFFYILVFFSHSLVKIVLFCRVIIYIHFHLQSWCALSINQHFLTSFLPQTCYYCSIFQKRNCVKQSFDDKGKAVSSYNIKKKIQYPRKKIYFGTNIIV